MSSSFLPQKLFLNLYHPAFFCSCSPVRIVSNSRYLHRLTAAVLYICRIFPGFTDHKRMKKIAASLYVRHFARFLPDSYSVDNAAVAASCADRHDIAFFHCLPMVQNSRLRRNCPVKRNCLSRRKLPLYFCQVNLLYSVIVSCHRCLLQRLIINRQNLCRRFSFPHPSLVRTYKTFRCRIRRNYRQQRQQHTARHCCSFPIFFSFYYTF